MQKIYINPSKSLRDAISKSMENVPHGSYQIMNTSFPRIQKNGKTTTLQVSKIRVTFDERRNRWFISEFVFSIDGEISPLPKRGDYLLIDGLEAFVY